MSTREYRTLILIGLLAFSCAGSPRYARPGLGPENYEREPARRAFWAGVAAAERDGLKELYAFEVFGLGEPYYEALALLRAGGRTVALYAEDQHHCAREDAASVPCRNATADAFDLLRRRIAAELPLDPDAYPGPHPIGGSLWVIHVLRAGRSHSTSGFRPAAWPPRHRPGLEEYSRRYPVHACYAAIWAAAPPELFALEPTDDPDPEGLHDTTEVYAKAPGYARN